MADDFVFERRGPKKIIIDEQSGGFREIPTFVQTALPKRCPPPPSLSSRPDDNFGQVSPLKKFKLGDEAPISVPMQMPSASAASASTSSSTSDSRSHYDHDDDNFAKLVHRRPSPNRFEDHEDRDDDNGKDNWQGDEEGDDDEDEDYGDGGGVDDEVGGDDPNLELNLKCPFCPFVGRNLVHIERHKEKHTFDPNDIKCPRPECGEKLSSKKAIRRHLNAVHGVGKPRKVKPDRSGSKRCGICRNWVKIEELAAHDLANHVKPPCKRCGQEFISQRQRTLHKCAGPGTAVPIRKFGT